MKTVSLPMLASALALVMAAPVASFAQDAASSDAAAPDSAAQDSQAPPQEAAAPAANQAQLSALLAPIALYPDPLLTDILAASTYPLEVVEADRWLSDPGNAALTGDALLTAVQQKDWDPSVKSLVPFPQILKMMDDRLSWTQLLGNTFLAQQADVMDTVQQLRRQAQAAGGLQSTQQQVVADRGGDVEIEPANPQQVSVPAYDPNVVYGAWPNPAVPPMAVTPYYPGYDDIAFDDGWYFGPPVFIGSAFWFWGGCDWHHHHLWVDGNRFGRFNGGRPFGGSTVWQHDPVHRRGVVYQTATLQQRYAPNRMAAPSFAQGAGFARPPMTESAASPHSVAPVARPPVAPAMPQQQMSRPAQAFPAQPRPVQVAPGQGQPVQGQPGRPPTAPVARPPVAMPRPMTPSRFDMPSMPYRAPAFTPQRAPAMPTHYWAAPAYHPAAPTSFASPYAGAHYSAPSGGGAHFSAPSGGSGHSGGHR